MFSEKRGRKLCRAAVWGAVAALGCVVVLLVVVVAARKRVTRETSWSDASRTEGEATARRIDLLVISGGADVQLNRTKTLLNSILISRCRCVLHVHALVDPRFMADLWAWSAAWQTPCTSLKTYDLGDWIQLSRAFLNSTGFRSRHHALQFGILKLFVPQIVDDPAVETLIVLDTDQVALRDACEVLPYVDRAVQRGGLVGITCLPDSGRIQRLCGKCTQRCDANLYCISSFVVYSVGRMRVLGIEWGDWVLRETQSMLQECPGSGNSVYRTGDQDIFNRLFAARENGWVYSLPCRFNCFENAFGAPFRKGKMPGSCNNTLCAFVHYTAKKRAKDKEFFPSFSQAFGRIPPAYLRFEDC